MRVLITGAGGQVATALRATAPASVQVQAVAHSQLDIGDASAVKRTVLEFSPDVIINGAAFTAVDRAESEPRLAARANADGPLHLAGAAALLPSCRLLHISTDYVFDGSGTRPYLPMDDTHPLGIYGKTKLDGERAAMSGLPYRTVVLRTAWVYSADGHNFLRTMLRVMGDKAAVRVVADQIGVPTAALSVARVLWRLVDDPRIHGILHWSDSGPISWYEFARAIAEEASQLRLLQGDVTVEPIGSHEYPTPARRPRYSVLDCSATCSILGVSQVPWRDMLRGTLESIAGRRTA